jgi:hypothetical protein
VSLAVAYTGQKNIEKRAAPKMPVYDLNNSEFRTALCLEQPDRARRHAVAYIVKKHYGAAAVDAMIADWKKKRRDNPAL